MVNPAKVNMVMDRLMVKVIKDKANTVHLMVKGNMVKATKAKVNMAVHTVMKQPARIIRNNIQNIAIKVGIAAIHHLITEVKDFKQLEITISDLRVDMVLLKVKKVDLVNNPADMV